MISLDPVIDFGYKNLLVSGCSFTHSLDGTTWPYHLQQLGSFQNLIECGCFGAGNLHIHHSVIWAIENNPTIIPEDTLVIVMWSGYDRDDIIVDPASIDKTHTCQYRYTDQAWLAITGGEGGKENTVVPLDTIKKVKNLTSRSIDNYILISSLYHYLTAKKFKFVFTDFYTPSHVRDSNFEPTLYLGSLSESFNKMTRQVSPNLGDYADILSLPSRHPTGAQQLQWCLDVLIPHLKSQQRAS